MFVQLMVFDRTVLRTTRGSLTDVDFKGATLLCLADVTVDNMAPLLQITMKRIVFNKQACDCPIFTINQKFHAHVCLRLEVIVNDFS